MRSTGRENRKKLHKRGGYARYGTKPIYQKYPNPTLSRFQFEMSRIKVEVGTISRIRAYAIFLWNIKMGHI